MQLFSCIFFEIEPQLIKIGFKMNLPKQTRYALAGLLILGLSLSVFFWFKKKSASESLNNEAVKDVPAVESTPPKTAGEILLSEFKTFDNEKIKERIEKPLLVRGLFMI